MKPRDIERRFRPGDCILDVGSSERILFVIRAGQVRLGPVSGDGGRLLGPGDLFGEVTAVLGIPSADRVVAEEEVSVLALSLPVLNRLCRESPEFCFRLVRHLTGRVAEAAGESEHPVPAPAPARPGSDLEILAAVLVDCRASSGVPAPVEGKLRDLAEGAGLTMPATHRALHLLLERGWVCLRDDQLTVMEPELLTGLAGG